MTGDKPVKKKFKAYPIGYFHIDIAEVRTEEGRLYLLVAIDRTSKFAFVELHEKVTTGIAGDFLRALIKAVTYKVHTVLTDHGIHFTTPSNTASAVPLIKKAMKRGELFRAHAFEYACAQNDVDHRLTKPRHPWTTDVIDKSFFASTGVFSSRARVALWQRAGLEVQTLSRSLYRRSSFRAPVRTFPDCGPRGFQPATNRA
jgi:hypothetical protein